MAPFDYPTHYPSLSSESDIQQQPKPGSPVAGKPWMEILLPTLQSSEADVLLLSLLAFCVDVDAEEDKTQQFMYQM